MSYFSPAAFFIAFREFLEGALVVGIMLAYTKKTGTERYNKYIWWGTISACVAASLVGLGLSIPYWVSKENLLSGKSLYIFEGVLGLLAAGLLTWMIVWTTTMGKAIQEELENKLDSAIERDSKARMFLIPFFQIFREGVEFVIFIFGVGAASSWESIPIPAVLGGAVAVVLAVLVFRGSINVPLNTLLQVSSYILLFFAAGLVGYATHELQEANWFGAYKNYGTYPDFGFTSSLPDVLRGWDSQTLYSTQHLVDDKTNYFGGIMRTLFGYQDMPTALEWIAYCAYWIIALMVIHVVLVKKGLTHKTMHRTLRTLFRVAAGSAWFWCFLQFIYCCATDQHPVIGFVSSVLGLALFTLGLVNTFSGNSVRRPDGQMLSGYSKRTTMALVFWVAAAVYFAYSCIIIFVQLGDAADCFDPTALAAGFVKVYDENTTALNNNGTYQAFLHGRSIFPDATRVTTGGQVCDITRLGTSYAHQLFFLNQAVISGPRASEKWPAGTVLVISLLINMVSGFFYVLYGYHTWQYLKQVASGTADGSSDGEEGHYAREELDVENGVVEAHKMGGKVVPVLEAADGIWEEEDGGTVNGADSEEASEKVVGVDDRAGDA